MPAFATFVLNDGTTDHTFTPVGISTEKSVLVSREGVTSAGNPTAILGLKLSNNGSAPNKATLRINQPIEEEVDGVTIVQDTFRFSSEWILPNRRTLAERTAFATMVGAAVSHALLDAYCEDLDPLYGG
jgi:hypothetical protein